MTQTTGVMNLQQSISYTRDGKEVTIKMSMGLLNVLMQAMGNYQNIALVGMDPHVNDLILRKLLTLRMPSGKIVPRLVDDVEVKTELESLAEIDVSVQDMEALLFFAQCHMADFSLRALQRAGMLNEYTKEAQTKLQALAIGLGGSLSSVSQTPSA